MRALVLVFMLFATSSASAAGVAVYRDAYIESWTGCQLTAHTFYAPTSTGVVMIDCAIDPTVLAYGYRPPRTDGHVVLHVTRGGFHIGGYAECGLVLFDQLPDDEPFVALDCRRNRFTTAGGAPWN